MRRGAKIFLWAAVLAALTGLFSCMAPEESQTPDAEADANTPLTLLTEEGSQTISMAEYLPHAVAGEMPASFGAEALKAQAVAARTYVMTAGHHDDGDVCTDSACCLAYMDEQALRALWGEGYDTYWAMIVQADSVRIMV